MVTPRLRVRRLRYPARYDSDDDNNGAFDWQAQDHAYCSDSAKGRQADDEDTGTDGYHHGANRSIAPRWLCLPVSGAGRRISKRKGPLSRCCSSEGITPRARGRKIPPPGRSTQSDM